MYAIEMRPLQALKPAEQNSRVHSEAQVDQIAASLKKFGWTMPVLVDENGVLIAGHARVRAAQKLGWDEAPCRVAEGWPEAKKTAYQIADNKLAENASWDNEILRSQIKALDGHDFDLTVLGFDSGTIDRLLETPFPVVGKVDENDAPPAPETPFVKEGDVWLCGPHRLICGDATSPDTLAALCAGDSVSLYLTDPPYNVDYEGSTGMKIAGDHQPDEQFRKFLSDAYKAADLFLKPGGAFYIWYADTEAYNFHGALRDVSWRLRQVLVWKKSSFVLSKQDYHWIHETSLYGNKEGGDVAWYYPEHENGAYGWKDGASHEWSSDRKQTTVLEFDKPSKNADHPTMKPVALFQYLMENSTKAGDVVLDSFAGSGTTLIAAAQSCRIARLCELDPRYAQVILERWLSFSGEEPTLAISGMALSDVKKSRMG
jgi:DNA modification methylase